MYQWCRISFINSRLNMIKTHPHLYLGPFQHLGGSNTKDVNRTMDIRWVLAAVTDGARDLCKSSRYCEILTKMRETSLIIIHKSCLILYFPWNIWVLVWLSADLRCLGIIPTRSVGSFLWEACLFQPWRNRHGQSSTAQQLRRLCSQRSSWKLRLRRFKSRFEVKDPREPISEPWWDDDTTLVAFVLGEDCYFFRNDVRWGIHWRCTWIHLPRKWNHPRVVGQSYIKCKCFFRFAIQISNWQSLSFDGFQIYAWFNHLQLVADCERKSC